MKHNANPCCRVRQRSIEAREWNAVADCQVEVWRIANREATALGKTENRVVRDVVEKLKVGHLRAAVVNIVSNGPAFGIGFDVLLKFENSQVSSAGFALPRGAAGLCFLHRKLLHPGFQALAVGRRIPRRCKGWSS